MTGEVEQGDSKGGSRKFFSLTNGVCHISIWNMLLKQGHTAQSPRGGGRRGEAGGGDIKIALLPIFQSNTPYVGLFLLLH